MSPIASLVSANLLDENIFSLRLSRGANDGLGQLVLGGHVDDSFFDGELVTIPVTDRTAPYAGAGQWKVTAQSLTLGDGSQIHVDFKNPTIAVFDTTYPWIALSVSLATRLNAFLESEDWGPFSFVDCTKRPRWPDVAIVLAGQRFVLTPYDYVIEQEEHGRIYCMSAFFPGVEDDAGVVLLGSAFLKAWVTVWDLENRTVGCKCVLL